LQPTDPRRRRAPRDWPLPSVRGRPGHHGKPVRADRRPNSRAIGSAMRSQSARTEDRHAGPTYCSTRNRKGSRAQPEQQLGSRSREWDLREEAIAAPLPRPGDPPPPSRIAGLTLLELMDFGHRDSPDRLIGHRSGPPCLIGRGVHHLRRPETGPGQVMQSCSVLLFPLDQPLSASSPSFTPCPRRHSPPGRLVDEQDLAVRPDIERPPSREAVVPSTPYALRRLLGIRQDG